MKKIYIYLMITMFAFIAFGCNKASSKKDLVNDTPDIMANLDTTANPRSNFYQYANGGWMKANPIKNEYGRYSIFTQLAEKNEKQINGLIEDLGKEKHEQGSVAQKIGDLHALAMDSIRLNAERGKPLQSRLDEINKAETIQDIIKLTAKIRKYANSPFFNFSVSIDDKNTSTYIVTFSQGGLDMGDRDYYLSNEPAMEEIKNGYKNLIKKQFINAGYTDEDAQKASDAVLSVETALANTHFTKEERRNPELNYNKIKVDDLKTAVTDFEWDLFFNTVGVSGFKEVKIAQIRPIADAIKLMHSLPIQDSKYYLSWCVISPSAYMLSDDFINADFDFYGKQMRGRQEVAPRWTRALNTVNGWLNEAVGQMYTEKYFPAEAKEKMIELVKNLQETFAERIDNLSWMSNDTKAKAKAKAKLNAFNVKIGYPDKWRDYSSLEINKEDSFLENIMRIREFNFSTMLSNLGKPVDRSKWLMSPQTADAYYNPKTNEICFPAGILQSPIFYIHGDDAVNYGAIGVVIAHELSHGFDDQGRKYDKNGNLANWWTDDDADEFNKRAQVLVNHFDNIEVLPGLFANGKFTLGENIGDFGGLQIAFSAFEKTEQAKKGEKIDGFTPEQRFFLSYAGVWAENVRDQEIINMAKSDPHSLGKWRVNGTLPHIDGWYKAFNITETDSLYIPKEKRADIW